MLHDTSYTPPVGPIAKGTRNSTTPTVTSTTFVDVDSTNLAATIMLPAAGRCLIGFVGWGDNSTTNAYTRFDIAIDGTRVGASTYGLVAYRTSSGATNAHNCSFTYLTDVLSAGSHTFKLQWCVSAGTGEIYADGAVGIPSFWAIPLSAIPL
jgi:hypothetical protein